MHRWLQILVLFSSVNIAFLQATDVPYIASIKISTLFQGSLKTCYFQYGEVVNLIKQYAPVKLSSRSYPYCICEHYAPVGNPVQMSIFTQAQDDTALRCTEATQIKTEQCDSFDSCETRFTIGTDEDENYEVLLECSSGTLENNNPQSLVEIFAISPFDVGRRCRSPGIANEINSKRLELYRKNSQFYRRILISQRDIHNAILNNCDSRLPTSPSFQLILKFRCTNSVPSIDTKWHTHPKERESPYSPRMAVGWPSCYEIRGPPRRDQFITELDTEFESGTEMCVCEQSDHIVLKMSEIHAGNGIRIKGEKCRPQGQPREFYCAEKSELIQWCQVQIYATRDALGDETEVVLGCKPDFYYGKSKPVPGDVYSTNLGTKYYPKMTASVESVHLRKSQDGKITGRWMHEHCGRKEWELYEDIKTQLNKMIIDRPNSEFHRRILFNPFTIADPFCTTRLSDQFDNVEEGGKYLYWEVNIQCD